MHRRRLGITFRSARSLRLDETIPVDPIDAILSTLQPSSSSWQIVSQYLPILELIEVTATDGSAVPLWRKTVSLPAPIRTQLSDLCNKTVDFLRPLVDVRTIPGWNTMFQFSRWLGRTLPLDVNIFPNPTEIICICIDLLKGPSYHLATLELLQRLAAFSETPKQLFSSLRNDDVLLIFESCLRNATTLESILKILNTLTRRRPDLIRFTLPQLIEVICAILNSLQAPRRATSTPNPHATALSRFLILLAQTRFGNNHEISPLAKHVPAILVTYVRAGADLHLGYTTSVRRDLEPGLLALCNLVTSGGRINSRGREGEGLAVPFGLGEGISSEGEKELYADLWQTWSKARYTGQG
ncbi:hypothetical protein IAR55_004556 [Kwoniella newhampshirensis]|uniref:Nucleolar 27S pre-rRNA processing Urb2/Npa2 C-terminal domain-containing protein n=1 Tax=Kwoniella newhampshirensis TaxID=1651941 RepID=A0AAW0YK14_9TREE